MGREIRRVPPNWEHPKTTDYRGHRYQPIYDRPYKAAIQEWIREHQLWEKGEHPDQLDGSGRKYAHYAEYAGNPPDVEYYRPEWPEGSATWYQVYETISEGTPVTPPFATKEELIEYLTTQGDFWHPDQPWSRENAERFVNAEWAPSLAIVDGKVYANADALTAIAELQDQS